LRTYLAPGVYIEEVAAASNPIQPVGTSVAGFVGQAPAINANVNRPVPVENLSQFFREFGGEGVGPTHLANAVAGFFANGGRRCYIVNTGPDNLLRGAAGRKAGVDVLEQIDEVAIVAAPGAIGAGAWDIVLSHCENQKDRIAVLDAPDTDPEPLTRVAVEEAVSHKRKNAEKPAEGEAPPEPPGQRPRISAKGFGALYYPWITVYDAVTNQRVNCPPSGHIAGIYARTDAERGVHKAPANETVRGALNVSYPVSRGEQELLNPMGVNCIRLLQPEGVIVWGARTLAAASSEWRYLNVRRLLIMVEESIVKSTRWMVFEPNDRPLWKSCERDVLAFLTVLWRGGAFMGRTREEACWVQCDDETNTPETIDQGMLITRIGVAPVKPAEFVVFEIGLSAGTGEGKKAEGGAANG
jgi:uncharacterized protein